MKLYYWAGMNNKKNFGDELNPYIWNKIFGDLLDDNDDSLLIGIGTILNERIPNAKRKAVFSSGVGYGESSFKIDDSYKIYCVRGPLSAKFLGLDERYVATDGALLLRNIYQNPDRSKFYKYAYIPHWENHSSSMAKICKELNIGYIDPTDNNIENVINQICSAEIILAEAMHGAIVADAYRVPWIPIKSTEKILDFKWKDWCMSMNLAYNPIPITPIWDFSKKSRIKAGKQLIKTALIKHQLSNIMKKSKPTISDSNRQTDLLNNLHEKLSLLIDDVKKGY